MIDQSCPWSQYEPGHLNFCEAKLCGWIVKPAETWSNIGYVLVGLFILYLAKKENRRHLSPIGLVAIILGIFSGIYHATGTFIGESLDISSMILFTSTGIVFNLRRLYGIERKRMLQIYLSLTLTSMLLIFSFKFMGIVLFALQFITAIVLEFLIYNRQHVKADYSHFKGMVVVFLVAWAVWTLDMAKILCDPDNHIFSGHAFWHLATSLTFYFVYRFYCQIKELESNP